MCYCKYWVCKQKWTKGWINKSVLQHRNDVYYNATLHKVTINMYIQWVFTLYKTLKWQTTYISKHYTTHTVIHADMSILLLHLRLCHMTYRTCPGRAGWSRHKTAPPTSRVGLVTSLLRWECDGTHSSGQRSLGGALGMWHWRSWDLQPTKGNM